MYVYVKKLALLELFLVLIFAAGSFAYSMWYEGVGVNAYVRIGEYRVRIGSGKAVSCCYRVEFECIQGDGESITFIVKDAFPGWCGWVGVVISNEGTLPVRIEDFTVAGEGDLSGYISVDEVYFYGPFKRDFKSVWGRVECEDLPFEGYVDPPVEFYPGEKIVVWAKIVIDSNAPYGSSGSITMDLSFSPSL